MPGFLQRDLEGAYVGPFKQSITEMIVQKVETAQYRSADLFMQKRHP